MEREKKRRFGISVPERLASLLDELSTRTGVDRSKLVTEAITSYVNDHLHYLTPHYCYGIMIIDVEEEKGEIPAGLLARYRDVVLLHVHTHLEGRCVNILVVRGDSKQIAGLHTSLALLNPNYRIRYIPLRSLDISG